MRSASMLEWIFKFHYVSMHFASVYKWVVQLYPTRYFTLPERFYGSCQGFCQARRIEFGFVGIHRPSSAGDAPSQDDESRGTG